MAQAAHTSIMPYRYKETIAAASAVLGPLSDRQMLLIDIALKVDRSSGVEREQLISIYVAARRGRTLRF